MDKIIGIGNALVDVLIQIEDDSLLDELQLPKASMQLIDLETMEKISAKTASMHKSTATGGSTCNAMKAIAEMKGESAFIGMIGNDNYGNFFEDTCTKKGIGTTLIRRHDMQTGVATTFISPDGERTFATYLGAASAMQDNDLDIGMMFGSRYILIEGFLVQDKKLMSKAAEIAERDGLRISLDMASYNIVENERNFFREFIRDHVDIVFANQEEAHAFTGCSNPEDALNEISALRDTAIVKLGPEGSIIRSGECTIHQPAMDVDKVVDTTGAGDFFAGGYLYGLSLGLSCEKCAKLGTLLSGHVIQHIGTTLSDETWNMIRKEAEQILG